MWDYLNILRREDECVYEGQPTYSTRLSLFHYLRAYDEISLDENGRFFCTICNELLDDAVTHCWMHHYDKIPAVYYPDQAPFYLDGCLRQIHTANLNVELVDGVRVRCKFCSHVLPTFHCFYTHCRLVHYKEFDNVDLLSPLELLIEHLRITGQVEENECKLCHAEFANSRELERHCWDGHGDLIAMMLKHRPINYSEETFRQSHALGMMCMNRVIIGQVCHGSITCGLCKIAFDDPSELFIHLFHRHTKLFAVKASEIGQWPMKFTDMPAEIQSILKRLCGQQAIVALDNANIYQGDPDNRKCNECGIDIPGAEAWEHAAHFHLIIVF
jgi:hypothetical protein